MLQRAYELMFKGQISGIGILFIGYLLYTSPPTQTTTSFIDKRIEVDESILNVIHSLLDHGKVTQDNAVLDLSPVQTVTVSDNKLTFNPPAKVMWRFLSTTITNITASRDDNSIFIDVDHSPVDIKLIKK